MAYKLITDVERLLRFIKYEKDCWIFSGNTNNNGYGQFSIGSRKDGSRRSTLAHRLSYELFKGKIPDGLHIDHLCRNRACINPNHLEAVTVKENIRRSLPYKPKTIARAERCKRGHCDWKRAWDGYRVCHTCRKEREKIYQRNRRLMLRTI